MDNDIKKMLKRQESWQKARKAESWIEKLNKSTAARKSLATYPGRSLKQGAELNDSSSFHDNTEDTC